ncbi:flagellar basal body-associated FliL family protein [Algirhabdus cladophorae]|uniref:flagellar basal body-associated FliL family protein n=1 Tax=Algirhabdus cladophorae TaxID=3377108 RepID=UPI003B847C54
MRKILPILLALIGLAGGVGAGVVLKPEPETLVANHPCGDLETMEKVEKVVQKEEQEEENSELEYVKLNNQFVVPVVKDNRVASLVIMSVSIEVTLGSKEVVFQREPKLRDAILTVLFDHAALGGFDGAFTSSAKLDTLRVALTNVTQEILTKDRAKSILITDLVRQDS